MKPLRVGTIWTYAKSLDNKCVYYSIVKYFITIKKVCVKVILIGENMKRIQNSEVSLSQP